MQVEKRDIGLGHRVRVLDIDLQDPPHVLARAERDAARGPRRGAAVVCVAPDRVRPHRHRELVAQPH